MHFFWRLSEDNKMCLTFCWRYFWSKCVANKKRSAKTLPEANDYISSLASSWGSKCRCGWQTSEQSEARAWVIQSSRVTWASWVVSVLALRRRLGSVRLKEVKSTSSVLPINLYVLIQCCAYPDEGDQTRSRMQDLLPLQGCNAVREWAESFREQRLFYTQTNTRCRVAATVWPNVSGTVAYLVDSKCQYRLTRLKCQTFKRN